MMTVRVLCCYLLLIGSVYAENSAPIPISDLWRSPAFQRVVTGSYGIDSRIEPLITKDEEEYLLDGAKRMAAGDRKGAIALYEGSSLLPESPAMLFSLAGLYFEEEEQEKAADFFQKAIEKFPNFRDAHRNLAIVLVQQEKIKEAKRSLIRAVELGARDGVTLGMLAYCHFEAEDYQAALQSYRQAQITMPDEMQWKHGEAQCLQVLGETTMAVALFREILKRTPLDRAVWLNLAYSLQKAGDEDAAIGALEVVRSMDGMRGSDLLALGHLYLNRSLPDQALDAYSHALQGETAIGEEKAIRALEYLTDLSFWKAADQLWRLIRETFPDSENKKLPRLQALIEFETGNRTEAIETIRAIVKTDPLDGQSLLVLAQFLKEERKVEEAIHTLEQAALLEDFAADAHLKLGEIFVDQGKYLKACECVEQSQAIAPRESVATYLEAIRELAN